MVKITSRFQAKLDPVIVILNSCSRQADSRIQSFSFRLTSKNNNDFIETFSSCILHTSEPGRLLPNDLRITARKSGYASKES